MQNSPLTIASGILLLLATIGGGCAPDNPSFPLTAAHARAELNEMEASPTKLERPLVIIGGFLDPGIGPRQLAANLRDATGAKKGEVILISLFWCGNFDECRRKIVESVDAAWPSDDPDCTREVDVIGQSMGGIAARYAALPPGAFNAPQTRESSASSAAAPTPRPAGRRLKIHRLFTLASPHRGAVLADVPGLMPLHLDMRRGSDFLTRLNALDSGEFPIIPYTRVPDTHVGSAYTAPPGQNPIWMPNAWFEEPHLGFFGDPRVAADVARRLRGEPSYSIEPRAPVPN
jgi:hypothetical protein